MSCLAAVEALFLQCGVIRAESLDQLLHVAGLLSAQPEPRGRRVAIVSNGGGAGLQVADACAQLCLEIAKLEGDTASAISLAAPNAADADNPVDLGASGSAREFTRVLELVACDPNVDAVIAVHAPTPTLDRRAFTSVLETIADRMAGTTTVAVALDDTASRADGRRPGDAAYVPVFNDAGDAARALALVMDHLAWSATSRGELPDLIGIRARVARQLVATRLDTRPGGCSLAAHDTKQLLGHYGIDVVPAVHIMGAEAAVHAANVVGYPVRLELADTGTRRRTGSDGARPNLADADGVRDAYEELVSLAGKGEPGMLVQSQTDPGTELVAGVVQDPVFGALVTVGAGGTEPDGLVDRIFRLTPLTTGDAETAMHALRCSPSLYGYRNSPACDVTAIQDLLLRLGRLADDLPEVAEINLDPVTVYEHGIAIVDAIVRLKPASELTNPILPRLRPPYAS